MPAYAQLQKAGSNKLSAGDMAKRKKMKAQYPGGRPKTNPTGKNSPVSKRPGARSLFDRKRPSPVSKRPVSARPPSTKNKPPVIGGGQPPGGGGAPAQGPTNQPVLGPDGRPLAGQQFGPYHDYVGPYGSPGNPWPAGSPNNPANGGAGHPGGYGQPQPGAISGGQGGGNTAPAPQYPELPTPDPGPPFPGQLAPQAPMQPGQLAPQAPMQPQFPGLPQAPMPQPMQPGTLGNGQWPGLGGKNSGLGGMGQY